MNFNLAKIKNKTFKKTFRNKDIKINLKKKNFLQNLKEIIIKINGIKLPKYNKMERKNFSQVVIKNEIEFNQMKEI